MLAEDLLQEQINQLPRFEVAILGEDDDVEESIDLVDVPSTLARFHRHREAMSLSSPPAGAKYEAYVISAIDALGLANFTGEEFVLPHKRVTIHGVKNELVPPSLLPRYMLALTWEQYVRNLIGAERLNSLFRARLYNLNIGGASKSQHRACAIDASPLRASVSDMRAAVLSLQNEPITLLPHQVRAIRRVCRDAGLPGPPVVPFSSSVVGEPFNPAGVSWSGSRFTAVGGVGTYSTFIHRDWRGISARW